MSRSQRVTNPDLQPMSLDGLKEWVSHCIEVEASCRGNKGRRTWKAARQKAEAELEKREGLED